MSSTSTSSSGPAPRRAAASAPPNIALVKYWGKRDDQRNLPAADSVALCLDGPRTHVLLEPGAADAVRWNGTLLPPERLPPYRRLLDHLRSQAPDPVPVLAEVTTRVPVAAGLAGSAAVMAAFAAAAAELFGLTPDQQTLSAAARLGSGSAARSVPDGFTYWQRGRHPDGSDSFTASFAPHDHWPELRLLAVLLETGPKRVGSTEGMIRTAATSPWFPAWVDACNRDAPLARDAILARDFASLAEIAERQAFLMHGLCLTARPPILYLSPAALDFVEALRRECRGIEWFVSFDAGSNPLLFTRNPDDLRLAEAVAGLAPTATVLTARPGPGVRLEPVGPPDVGSP